MWLHLPITVGALVWAWLERPRVFPVARNVFLLAQALTVAGYLLVPTAPPRLVEGLGFEDTLASFWGNGAAHLAHTVQSPYAAMPSGHVAFALVAGGVVAALARPLAVRALAVAYPALVTAVTILTANHLWLDALAAAVVVAASFAVVIATPVTRRRVRATGWPSPVRLAEERPPAAG